MNKKLLEAELYKRTTERYANIAYDAFKGITDAIGTLDGTLDENVLDPDAADILINQATENYNKALREASVAAINYDKLTMRIRKKLN